MTRASGATLIKKSSQDRREHRGAHLEEVVAGTLGGGVEGLLGAELERREVGAVGGVVGDVAGDVRGLLSRGAGRRLHLLRGAALALRHGGLPMGGRWGIASSSWRQGTPSLSPEQSKELDGTGWKSSASRSAPFLGGGQGSREEGDGSHELGEAEKFWKTQMRH
jgi:hypothetical protein